MFKRQFLMANKVIRMSLCPYSQTGSRVDGENLLAKETRASSSGLEQSLELGQVHRN